MILRNAGEVSAAMEQMVNGPRDVGSEHIDLCVRFSTFSAFFEEHCLRVIRHSLADVRFSYFVAHYGQIPTARIEPTIVTEEDVIDDSKTVGPLKVLLAGSDNKCGNTSLARSWRKDTKEKRGTIKKRGRDTRRRIERREK